jgi:hypothetical protein
VVGAPGDPLLVGFFGLQPIANPKVPQAAASKTILNFMINDSSLFSFTVLSPRSGCKHKASGWSEAKPQVDDRKKTKRAKRAIAQNR